MWDWEALDDMKGIAEWKLLAIDPNDKHTWKSDVRSAILEASQLPGRGPTDIDVALEPACY